MQFVAFDVFDAPMSLSGPGRESAFGGPVSDRRQADKCCSVDLEAIQSMMQILMS